ASLVVEPVNYTMADGTILVRTSEGTVVDGHGDDEVAFEVDHIDSALRQGWSVLIHGRSHRVRQPAELRRLLSGRVPWPWPAGEHDVFIRIVPEQVSGRRIEAV
ncbi:MAG TPA: pyridoxamine 5'-phosphate oxidase family protein, partial [Streptosporangiaceae bacterium]|nr:pyridoxamine 5'-phosphate oxidase family protein [Streptosporangiaceae bacterium]